MSAQQPRIIDQPSYFRTGVSEEASATIPTRRIVMAGTGVDGILLATGSAQPLLGVSVEAIEAGKHQSYQVDGKAVVELGGTVAPGDLATSDSVGRGVEATLAAGTIVNVIGRFVTGGDSGDLAEVELGKAHHQFVGASSVADRAALAAIVAGDRFDGQLVLVRSDGSLWRFAAASTLTDDEAQELVVEPDAGTGAWLRADKAFVMKLPIAFTNTDGEAILTMPEGFALRLTGFPYWEITTPFSGGTGSTIGISTSKTGYDTEGDILGGASGDSTEVESAGLSPGTVGAELDLTGFHALLFVEGDEFRYDRITDAYTAGAGFVCIPVVVATAPATP